MIQQAELERNSLRVSFFYYIEQAQLESFMGIIEKPYLKNICGFAPMFFSISRNAGIPVDGVIYNTDTNPIVCEKILAIPAAKP